MPIITVAMFSGRIHRKKDRFAEAITENRSKYAIVVSRKLVLEFE